MRAIKSPQYTVRNVPTAVDQALRVQAKRSGKSFNQTVIEALKQGTGVTDMLTKHADLDWFIGGGVIDATAFDESQRWLDALPNELR